MVDDLLTRIRLGMAAELAAAGAHLQAESWVVGAPGTLLSPAELDLLARIYVQQERYTEARACWQKAHLAIPSNPVYERALVLLNEHLDRLRVYKTISKTLYISMVAIGILAVTIILLFGKPL
jgi:tetratricopeptide (TPR) repeat protein